MSEVTQEKTREKIKKVEDELALQDFGRELRRLRKLRGLTQKTLYEITGVDDTVISDMERGTYTPSLSMIRELADGLEINPHILVAAYYGVPLPEFNLNDKETLDSLIKIALDYLARQHQPQPPALTNPNQTDISERGNKNLNAASAARRKKRIDKPTENNQ